jgi:diadenosine tetraphosphate (Ap4A) HIT family hydrolase/protein-tyrosine-phosphatase
MNVKKEIKPRKILFVCTGNIFRSLSAKYCLEDYIRKNNIKDTIVDSAGTIAGKEAINPIVLSELNALGIDSSKHVQKKLSKKDLEDNDLVIVMAKDHLNFINKNFNFDETVLFNEVVTGDKTSILDVNEAIPDWHSHERRSERYLRRAVRYIYKKTPRLYKNLDRYFLFLDFINGRKTQKYGFPFMPLHETKNTVSFMSIAIPQKEDGHILVIPKKRYSHLDNIPKDVLSELISSVAIIGKAIRKTCGGYNIIVNNGSDAGQYIFHSHFHIIPRNKNDDIKIEIWKNKKLTQDKFVSLNKKIKEIIKR